MLKKSMIALGMLSCISSQVMAAPNQTREIIAPTCLLKTIAGDYQTLATNQHFSLLQLSETQIDALAEAKHAAKNHCGNFKDVSLKFSQAKVSAIIFLSQETTAPQTLFGKNKAYKIQNEALVNKLMTDIQPQTMWANLTTLTSFKDRYSKSANGVVAAAWIKSEIEKIVKATHHDDVTISYIETGGSYKQPSVVAKFGKGDGPGIVIGGHMDTLASTFSNKPGADDDGSGTVTVMETARTLLASGTTFNKPIYFIWYSAEEQGMVGSSAVVANFKKQKIKVDAVIQFDMTGYAHKNEKTMWLIDDNVDKDLTKYLENLMTTYIKVPVKHTRCGYACSDHATWNQEGFVSSMPSETMFDQMNPDIHSANDEMSHLSLTHMTDYVKLGVAFAGELADPVK